MPPSSLYFGGDRQSDGVEDLGLSFVSAPKAYAITGLLTANGRSLPEEADIFWGHEIWLIQLPWLMVPGRDGSGARSIGLSVRFPEQAVEIVDCLPRGSTPDQVTTVDVSWAGRIANPENDSALVEPDALRLDFDADIRLYTDATMLGRLTYSRSNTKVLSAVVGVAEALWVLQPPDPYMGAVGTMWLTAITDKHVARLNIEVRSWIEMTGLNNVPARLVAEPVTLEVTLVTEPK
ncbi:MAG TPA: hypothetical protein VI485_06380 [Vicinamibacterales bacterium]|nr:hypothetical protein [Vicinamibacterales bacterium]